MKQYTLVIIGFGGMGRQHARLISTVDNIFVKGIYDILPEVSEYAKSEGYFSYENLESVLEDKEVDLVLIATPNHVHKEVSIKALESGKQVICEKPVTLNQNELKEILAVEKLTGNHFFVHQNRRWDEDFLTVKKACDEGMLGEVYHIETRVHGSRGIPGDWRNQKNMVVVWFWIGEFIL